MAIETITATAECPECLGALELKDVMQSEIVQCPECASEFEVVSIDPLTLEQAPEEEEDWGE